MFAYLDTFMFQENKSPCLEKFSRLLIQKTFERVENGLESTMVVTVGPSISLVIKTDAYGVTVQVLLS